MLEEDSSPLFNLSPLTIGYVCSVDIYAPYCAASQGLYRSGRSGAHVPRQSFVASSSFVSRATRFRGAVALAALRLVKLVRELSPSPWARGMKVPSLYQLN